MAKNLLVLHIEVFTIYSKIKNPSYLDTDQETWSVRFPHDIKKLSKKKRIFKGNRKKKALTSSGKMKCSFTLNRRVLLYKIKVESSC